MFLHQQLVDNILLLTSKQLYYKIYSKYTYSIIVIVTHKTMFKMWYIYYTTPNTITKLQYQLIYSNYYEFPYFYKHIKWDYIKGPTYYDYSFAIQCNNINLFKICLKYNVKPTEEIMNKAVSYNNLKIFKMCIEVGLKPTQKTFNNLEYHFNIEIINICISFGCKPNRKTMENAILFRNINLFNKCLPYIQPNTDILMLAAQYSTIEIFKLCLNSGAEINHSIMRSLIYRNCDIKLFKICLSYGYKPDSKIMELIKKECNEEILALIN